MCACMSACMYYSDVYVCRYACTYCSPCIVCVRDAILRHAYVCAMYVCACMYVQFDDSCVACAIVHLVFLYAMLLGQTCMCLRACITARINFTSETGL
jgi:hypothetical protein